MTTLSTEPPANEQALNTWTKQPLRRLLTVSATAMTAAILGLLKQKTRCRRRATLEEERGRGGGRKRQRQTDFIYLSSTPVKFFFCSETSY